MAKFQFADDPTVYEAKDEAEARQQRAARYRPGMVRGLAEQFGQGLSLGGADEATAGLESVTGRRSYEESMRNQRRSREAFQSEHPYLSAAALATGAVAPVVASTVAGTVFGTPAGGAAAATTTSARAAQLLRQALAGGTGNAQRANTVLQAAREGAKGAATPGAVAGYLSGDPDKAGWGGRAGSTVTGAGLGVGLGAGLGGGSQLVSNAGERLVPTLRETAEKLGINELGGLSWARPASQRGTPPQQPITHAENITLKRLEEGRVRPRDAATALQQAHSEGVPLGLVDVGGQPVQREARAIRTLPGQGSADIDRALVNRAQAQGQRLQGHVEGALGQRATGSAGETIDELLEVARRQSAPLYRLVDRIPPTKSRRVRAIFETVPDVRQLVQQHEQRLAGAGQPFSPLYDDQGKLLRNPTFRDIDNVKQAIDEGLRFDPNPRPQTRTFAAGQEADLARGTRAELIDAANNARLGGIYRRAREAYAGPAEARTQFQEGGKFRNEGTKLADVRARVNANDPGQNEWYRRGVAENIREGIDSVSDLTGNSNRLRAFAGSPEARSKVYAASASPAQAARLERQLAAENQAAQTNNFVRSGSQTADKAAEAMDVAGDVITAAGDLAKGSGTGVASGTMKLLRALRGKVGEETRVEIARHLTQFDDPAAQQAFLSRLDELQQRGLLNAQGIAEAARVTAATNNLRSKKRKR